MTNLKMIVVGDGAVGKSSLLITYNTNAFPSEYVPTVFDNYAANVMLDGKPVTVGFWDTAGQEDYDRLRPLSYPQTDVALVCFSIASRNSLANIEAKWIPELKHYIPDVPILMVGCKSDLRRPGDSRFVTQKEAGELAKKMGIEYRETSSLLHEGLKECMDTALRMGVSYLTGITPSKKSFFGGKSKKKEGPQPPVMPPAGKAPWLEMETAVFADQWKNMLEDPRHADVTFIVDGKHELKAHKVILASTSKFFRKVLRISNNKKPNQLEALTDDATYTLEQLNAGQVLGISRVFDELTEMKSTSMTFIEIAADISGKTFAQVLQFLYTGVPTFADDVSEEDLDLLIQASRTLELPQLETICVNQRNEEEFLNPSIGTYLNDETGQKMKDMFFNNQEHADISFKVGGEKIWAHKVVLSARCEVMAAMFSGYFAEGNTIAEIEVFDTSSETFLALLEYLYTDHAPIEEGDSVGILVLANQYCQSRLINLCELYITKEVDKSCYKQIEKSEIDVIGLLLTAQLHNAEQLANWCLHFISTNFQAFQKRQEFSLLEGTNLEYVEEHQWPPLDYLKGVQEYEEQMAAMGSKCVVM